MYFNRYKNSGSKYSAVNVVMTYIESLIMSKELKPGDKIPTEIELGEILNLGRGSIREAIKILEANGLVTIKRGDGTYVSYPEDIILSVPLLYKMILSESIPRELLEFREEIEITMMRMAIKNANKEDILNIKKVHREFKDYIDSRQRDVNMLSELDYGFHLKIAESTKNRYYQQLYLFTMELFLPLITNNYAIGQDPEESYEVHDIMLKIIETRDYNNIEEGVKAMVATWGNWVFKEHDR